MLRLSITQRASAFQRTSQELFSRKSAVIGLRNVSAAVALIIASSQANADPATTGQFTWKLTNKFRLLTNEDEEKRFAKEFDAYQKNAAGGNYSFNPLKWQRHYARLTDRPYASSWNPATAQYDLNYVRSQNRPAELTFAGGKSCEWTVNGTKVSGNSCENVPVTLKVNVNTVALVADGKPVNKLEQPFVKDYFAVVLGNSTASGEGNPEVPASRLPSIDNSMHTTMPNFRFVPAKWLDERCHRSMISAPLLALFKKSQDGGPHQSVTVIDYACSGAEIDNGIIDGNGADGKPVQAYQGREVPEQTQYFYYSDPAHMPPSYPRELLPNQVTQVDEALCVNENGCKKITPDAVFVITGANDLHFSDVLINLIECANQKCINDEGDRLDASFKLLHEKFSQLHARIQQWSPHQVLLGGYIDPSRTGDLNDPDNVKKLKYCDDDYLTLLRPHFLPDYLGIPASLVGAHLGQKKSEFAHDKFVVPLDRDLSQLAKDYRADHWVFVHSYTEASKTKGICSAKRWVLTYEKSATKQGILERVPNPDPHHDNDHRTVGGAPTGAMHPNVFGHLAMRDAFLAKMIP